MGKPSELHERQEILRQKIIGLGDRSFRKSYYPQLQQQLHELEEHKLRLEEQSEELLVTLEELNASRKSAQESEKKFRALFENAIDGILLVDSRSKQCYMGNKMLCRMFGYSEKELSALPVELLFPEEERPALLDSLDEQSRRHGRLLSNMLVRRKDRSRFYADINTTSINVNDTPFWTGVFRDVTERKRAEEDVHTLNVELERRVQERTAELESANRELREFASVVSHDLKSPLRGIKQLANWLVEDYTTCFDREGRDMIDLLMGRVRHMDQLIDGILKYSRAGQVLGDEEDIDVEELLKMVQDALAPPETVAVNLTGPFPVVTADRMRLAQVFQNLLENAVKFIDTADGKVSVSCLDRGGHWQFCVADNGPGIVREQHKRIFRIFQSAHRNDEGKGSGIGLALVKKILEAGGEKIWVESTPGEGSHFYFTLKKGGREDEKSQTDSYR